MTQEGCVPIRRGLLAHYQKLGTLGVAMYVWLLLKMDPATRRWVGNIDVLREAVGTGRNQAIRTLALLEDGGYVQYERGNRFAESGITVLKADCAVVGHQCVLASTDLPCSIVVERGKTGPMVRPKPEVQPVDPRIAQYVEIVAHLNDRAGTTYRPTSDHTRRFIRARLNEGFTVEDFRTVITAKCVEWRDDPQMSKYLRPETLFGTKFEGYLNTAKKAHRPARAATKKDCWCCEGSGTFNGGPCDICEGSGKL
jgi:uncharacterized phage protein (TIGR02220 family)